jgi:hypothetical protein
MPCYLNLLCFEFVYVQDTLFKFPIYFMQQVYVFDLPCTHVT